MRRCVLLLLALAVAAAAAGGCDSAPVTKKEPPAKTEPRIPPKPVAR